MKEKLGTGIVKTSLCHFNIINANYLTCIKMNIYENREKDRKRVKSRKYSLQEHIFIDKKNFIVLI